jgi:cytochrome c-type biogenesis protein CcmF
MALGVTAIAIFLPGTRVLTPILSERIRLPMSLCCFALVIFTLTSVGQEFWVGTRVRRKQSGSDPLTALIGLVLSKRRKYGGYVIHVAIAVMFFGFAGKAYESMEDFTLSKPGETFEMRGYTFRYLELSSTDDDYKHAVTGKMELLRGGERLAEMEPARWKYKKYPNEPTTEVDIHSHLEEDVYLILTGFDPDTKVANFRVYINPLVNWVWLGFAILALGTALCLIPQHWVDRMTLKRARTRLGKAGQAAVVLLLTGAITAAMVRVAMAQAPPEYQADNGHMTGASAAHLFRPNAEELLAPYRAAAEKSVHESRPELDPGSADFKALVAEQLKPVSAVAERCMRDLVCLCGGCQRETVLECRCGYAAQERQEVLSILKKHDLSTPEGRETAYKDVIDKFVAKYEAKRAGDGQRVLMVPVDSDFNRLSWLVPYVAFGGGLALLFAFGRRWVQRGQSAVAAPAGKGASPGPGHDDEYAELLDDELRDTD